MRTNKFPGLQQPQLRVESDENGEPRVVQLPTLTAPDARHVQRALELL